LVNYFCDSCGDRVKDEVLADGKDPTNLKPIQVLNRSFK
jgi:hypothetical protein